MYGKYHQNQLVGRLLKKLNSSFDKIFDLVTNVRKLKSDNGIRQRDEIGISIINKSKFDYDYFKAIIYKLSVAKNLKITKKDNNNYLSFLSDSDTIFLEIKKSQDSKEETLNQIKYLEGFLASVNKKLENKSFVDNAPKQVIDNEIKKRDDALSKLEILRKKI